MKKEATPNPQLRAARLEKCWTLAKAAEKVGVSYEAYSRWEYGRQDPRLDSLLMICDAFAMSPEELGFGHIIKKPLEPKANDKAQTREATQKAELIQLTREQVLLLSSRFLGDETMTFDQTKRKAIQDILAIAGITMTAPLVQIDPEPWERLASAKMTHPSHPNSETYAHFEAMVGDCWGLSNSGELIISEQVLSTFLPKMLQLASNQPKAATIAAHGLRLQSVLTAHKLHLDEKVRYCQQAVNYARFSNNANALVISLTELAVAYKYAKQPEESLKTYQEALFYVEHASPLLQSRVYAASASAFAKNGRKREARFYIDLASEVFPSEPEQDPAAPLADYGIWLLIFYTGLIHLDLGEYQQAFDSFDKIRSITILIPERNRLEIINQQGRAAILLNERELYAASLEDSISNSIALRSKKRFNEAVNIFQEDMPTTWLKEDPIKMIAERFNLQQSERA